MSDQCLQAGREALYFRGPVGQQRSGSYQQAGPGFSVSLLFEHQQQRENLYGFTQTHIVREAGTEAEPRQQIKPAHAHLLIRTQ